MTTKLTREELKGLSAEQKIEYQRKQNAARVAAYRAANKEKAAHCVIPINPQGKQFGRPILFFLATSSPGPQREKKLEINIAVGNSCLYFRINRGRQTTDLKLKPTQINRRK